MAHGYQNTGLRDLRDRCDGNIKMKLIDEHVCALIVDFTCMSTSGFVNTILRIRNFIIRSVVTSTSKTISTNFSKYGHRVLHVASQTDAFRRS